MQTVGAPWLLVDEPNAAALVSWCTPAGTLPMMVLALPGGVLADSFDLRRLITVQAYLFVVAILLVVLTAVWQMPPALLLAFTLALGARAAVQSPAWLEGR